MYRGANTVPDNPSAGVGWVDAVTCVDVFGVMNQYVRGMVDASAAAYPDNNRLMMLTDNIQIHHISLQYGGQWRTTCVPAANLSTDVVKPQCNLDVSAQQQPHTGTTRTVHHLHLMFLLHVGWLCVQQAAVCGSAMTHCLV